MCDNVFYRVLLSEEHLKNWRIKHFHSYHHFVPGEWSKIWNDSGSTSPEDYPLKVFEGVFTRNAVISFLNYSPTHSPADQWSAVELKLSSELSGVCAFDNPIDALLHYGQNSVFGKNGFDRYVVVNGSILCEAPEDKGYVITVENIIEEFLTAIAFKAKYIK